MTISVGDYIEVKDGVHDDSMPNERRDGLIIEIVGKREDQALIIFSNGTILKFHKSQISVISNHD